MKRIDLVLRGRWLVSAFLVLALSLGVTACGGDDDDSQSAGADASAETTATQPTGPPVKVMVISPTDNPIIDWPMVSTGAEAAAEAINNAGGINGRPLEILTCNDQVDPNRAVQCARRAASEGVVAAHVNSLFTAQIYPVLARADIPAIGGLVTEPEDTQAEIAFPILPGTNLINGAFPGVLAEEGNERIAGVVAGRASTATDVGVMEAGAEASDAGFVGAVGIPEATTDYSPHVQRLRELDPDAAIVLLSRTPMVQLLRTARDLGVEVTWASNSYVLFPSMLSELGGIAEGLVALDPLPPASAGEQFPGVARFNEELDAAGADDEDDRALPGMQAWLAIHALAMVAEQVSGELTNTSLIEQLDAGESYDLMGLVDWTPGTSGPGDYERLSNGRLYQSVVRGDQLVVEDPEPIDGFALAGVE